MYLSRNLITKGWFLKQHISELNKFKTNLASYEVLRKYKIHFIQYQNFKRVIMIHE